MDIQYMTLQNSSGGRSLYLNEKPGTAVPYLFFMCLALLSGTVGNVLIIGAVFNNKNLRHVGNLFIVNLAFADLCVTGFVDPFSIVGIIVGEWWFEENPVLCELVASICLTSCFCSLLSIGAISFNRYIHICHNNLYLKMFTARNSVLMAIGLWCLSFLLELPNFFGWGDHVFDKKTQSCVWDRTADFSYTLFFALVGVAFPVSLISVCYFKIYMHVLDSKRRIHTHLQTAISNSHSGRDSMKLARTLFIIFMVFCICWTPYALVVVLDVSDTYPAEVHIFVILIAHSNSSINWILYGVTNRDFRRGYMRFLKLQKFKKFHNAETQVNGDQNLTVASAMDAEDTINIQEFPSNGSRQGGSCSSTGNNSTDGNKLPPGSQTERGSPVGSDMVAVSRF